MTTTYNNTHISDPPNVSVDKLEVESNPSCKPYWVHIDEGGVVRNISVGVRKNTRVVERGVGREMVSVVVIHSPQDSHDGEYVCRATIMLGQDRKAVI